MGEQTTYIMIKPDGVERGLTEEIVSRFQRIGLGMGGRRGLPPTLEPVLVEALRDATSAPALTSIL